MTPGRLASTRRADDSREVLSLVATGRLEALREARARCADPPSGDEILVVLGELDVSVRCYEATTEDVDRVTRWLGDAVSTVDRHRWFLAATKASLAISDGDFVAAGSVAALLHEVPTDLDCAPEIRYLRGRLRQAAALVAMAGASPTDLSQSEGRALRDAAIDDFRRGGHLAEVAMTRALWAALHAVLRWEEPRENLVRLVDARDELELLCDAPWRAPIDYLLAMAAFLVGDLTMTGEALDDLEQALPPSSPFAVLPTFYRLLATISDAADPTEVLAEIDRAIVALRGCRPQLVKSLQQQLANVLLDLGDPRAALYALPALDMPPTGPIHTAEHRVLALRLSMASGQIPTIGPVKGLLEEFEQLGLSRQAGAMALRLAADLRRIDAHADADALRVWGLDHLPAPSERTFWEALWAGAEYDHAQRNGGQVGEQLGDDAPPLDAAESSTTVIRVLRPALTIERDARAVEVRPTVAKLLVVLAIHHPSPLHAEKVTGILWPDADVASSRRRLNTVMHRLRQVLGDGPPVVRRRGELVSFEPRGVDVDLHDYTEALRGAPHERIGAISGVRGNLCHAQFPYDDHLVDQRRVFAAGWLRAARPLVRDGHLDPDDLAPALTALDLRPDDLR